MDSVLVALLVMILLITGVATLGTAWIASQRLATDAWEDLHERAAARAAVGISLTGAEVHGPTVHLTGHNRGEARLADYYDWDLILHCYTAAGDYRVERLDYAAAAPMGESWEVLGVYLNAAEAEEEVYNPGILDPGEDLVIRINLATPLDPVATHLAVLAAPTGATSQRQFSAAP